MTVSGVGAGGILILENKEIVSVSVSVLCSMNSVILIDETDYD
jgi:hypothetical protein